MSAKKIFLIDASSLFFRAFYAIRPLTSPAGLPTNAIYGFLTMVTKILKDEKPDYIVFCYDRKEPSFRKEIYNDYKANRSETPEDLVPQIPYIKKIADLFGIPSLEVARFEADDLIGTLTKVSRKHDLDVYIVSGDKDFGQLVGPHVWLFDTMKNIKYDSAGVVEKWGVKPEQMIDYLALVGDASDNVPGVMGIGPKGAQKLLSDFGSLENIYDNIEQIKGAIQEKLKVSKDDAFLSKKLVTIETEVPVAQGLESYHTREPNLPEIQKLLTELNFKNLEKTLDHLPKHGIGGASAFTTATDELSSGESSSSSVQTSTVEVPILAVENLVPFVHEKIKHHIQVEELSAQFISATLKPGQKIWGLQNQQGIYLGDADKKILYILRGDLDEVSKELQALHLHWNGYDLKSFWHQIHFRLNRESIAEAFKVIGAWDSMLAAYVLRAGESMTWERVLFRYLGETPGDLENPADHFDQQLRLQAKLQDGLAENRAEKKLFEELEMPLLILLFKMECYGIHLDRELLRVQSVELTSNIQELETKICGAAGEVFNIASPKQLAHILFDKLKLPPSKKTKTGFSTDNDVLDKLKTQHPIVDSVLEYRELAKLKSTYVDALPNMIKEDGRIHTTLNQALTATGRLSSMEPNLQNIPIRTVRGARVRKAFTAEPGKKLLSVDYSQIELRILAHYSGDKNLCEAFHQDLDIHAATAAEVFGVGLKEVTSEMRRTAKAVNFGIAYGQGAFGLAENLGISRTESADIIKKYFARFPGVRSYIDETIAQASRDGFVETFFGRRRYIAELKSSSAMVKKFGERAAINAPIQGTAADIVKMAMIKVSENIAIPMILQVHDELIFESSESDLRDHLKEICELMSNVISLKVPLKANAAIGNNWDEAH